MERKTLSFTRFTNDRCFSFDDSPLPGSEYDSSYSFGSPTDDWPTMSADNMEEPNRARMRRGPLKTIRRVAVRFKDSILAQ
jgi:hypothetical protein